MGSSGYHDSSLAKALWEAIWPTLARVVAILICIGWVSVIVGLLAGTQIDIISGVSMILVVAIPTIIYAACRR